MPSKSCYHFIAYFHLCTMGTAEQGQATYQKRLAIPKSQGRITYTLKMDGILTSFSPLQPESLWW